MKLIELLAKIDPEELARARARLQLVARSPVMISCPPSHMMSLTLAQSFRGIDRSVAPPLEYEPMPPMTRAEYDDVIAKMLRMDDLTVERARERAAARARFARMPRRFKLGK